MKGSLIYKRCKYTLNYPCQYSEENPENSSTTYREIVSRANNILTKSHHARESETDLFFTPPLISFSFPLRFHSTFQPIAGPLQAIIFCGLRQSYPPQVLPKKKMMMIWEKISLEFTQSPKAICPLPVHTP